MLPKILTKRIQSITGTHFDEVMQALWSERVGSLRINPLVSDMDTVLAELREKGIAIESYMPDRLTWVYVFERDQEYALKWTKAFYEGHIYLQSITSMLPVLVLDPTPHTRVLDVCAAPGSKTTQMAVMMQDQGYIVAIEQNQIRYDKLMHNVRLQWVHIVEWVKMDARKYLQEVTELYDSILLDAPCSAEGRISLQNEKSYGFWSLENIEKKAELQYDLLSLAWNHLRSGRSLVYSTCTLAPEENEWVITKFLLSYPDARIEISPLQFADKNWWQSGFTSWGTESYHPTLSDAVRILPSRETEGFFIVKLRKITNI